MSFCCPITVQFQVVKIDRLLEVAKSHLEVMKKLDVGDDNFNSDALRFLAHVAEGKGVGLGPKGDMLTWGHIGNYSNIDTFVDSLRGFWFDLYKKDVTFDFDGIIVMMQREQDPHMSFVEISQDRTASEETALVVRQRYVPFPLFEEHLERPEAVMPPDVRMTYWGRDLRTSFHETEG